MRSLLRILASNERKKHLILMLKHDFKTLLKRKKLLQIFRLLYFYTKSLFFNKNFTESPLPDDYAN